MTEGGGRGTSAASRDESVTFSLRELRELEEDRLAREARAREEDAARVEAARRETERRSREEAETAAAAREAARRDEAAKHEALQRAALEQTRLEVDVRAREGERERERRHEVEIARLRAETQKPGFGLAALGGAALVGGVTAGFAAFAVHMALVAPAAERRIGSVERDLATERRRAAVAQDDLERERRRATELERESAKLRSDLEAARKPGSPAQAGGHGGGSATPTHGPATKRGPESEKCVDPHDPMCFAIPR
jgi:colicin import membrane protein